VIFFFTSHSTCQFLECACQFLECACQLTCIFFLCKFLRVKREKLAKTLSNIYTAWNHALTLTLGMPRLLLLLLPPYSKPQACGLTSIGMCTHSLPSWGFSYEPIIASPSFLSGRRCTCTNIRLLSLVLKIRAAPAEAIQGPISSSLELNVSFHLCGRLRKHNDLVAMEVLTLKHPGPCRSIAPCKYSSSAQKQFWHCLVVWYSSSGNKKLGKN
jgi:hypothetical protein